MSGRVPPRKRRKTLKASVGDAPRAGSRYIRKPSPSTVGVSPGSVPASVAPLTDLVAQLLPAVTQGVLKALADSGHLSPTIALTPASTGLASSAVTVAEPVVAASASGSTRDPGFIPSITAPEILDGPVDTPHSAVQPSVGCSAWEPHTFSVQAKMPAKTIQLFVKGLEGKTMVLNISEDASIADLRKEVCKLSGIPADEIRILYTTKDLRSEDPNGKKMMLCDYGIQDKSNLTIVVRVLGGSNTEGDSNFVKNLPEDAETTLEPDMITLDDCTDDLRAKMPCGHAIGPDSLTAYCRSLLSAGKFEFRCPYATPYCGQLWDFYTVNRLAVLTENERKEFEIKIAENYARKAIQIQECPGCMTYCERQNGKNPRVICPVCSKRKRGLYEFCWCYLKTWLTGGTSDCGNIGCSQEDPRLKILRDCSMKEVVEIKNCPSVRACPKCGLLIEHTKACKQMTCPCGQKFCFICLKVQHNGRYQCGFYNSKCDVAPIQTAVP